MVKKRFYLCIVAIVAIAVLSSSTTFADQDSSARFENVIVTRNSKEQSMSGFSPVKGDIVRGETE